MKKITSVACKTAKHENAIARKIKLKTNKNISYSVVKPKVSNTLYKPAKEATNETSEFPEAAIALNCSEK